jgi:hypothetical protein
LKPLTPEEKKELKAQFRRYILSAKHRGGCAARRQLFKQLWRMRKGAGPRARAGGPGFGAPFAGFGAPPPPPPPPLSPFGFGPPGLGFRFRGPFGRRGHRSGPWGGFGRLRGWLGFGPRRLGRRWHRFGQPKLGFRPGSGFGPWGGFGHPRRSLGRPAFRPGSWGSFGGPPAFGFGGPFGHRWHHFRQPRLGFAFGPFGGFGGHRGWLGFGPRGFGRRWHRFGPPGGGFGLGFGAPPPAFPFGRPPPPLPPFGHPSGFGQPPPFGPRIPFAGQWGWGQGFRTSPVW